MAWLFVVHPPGLPSAAAESIVDRLVESGWTKAFGAFCLTVLVHGRAPPAITPLVGGAGVGGVIVGRIFDRAATDRGAVTAPGLDHLIDQDPLDACAALVDRAWGSYVAVLAGRRQQPPTVLRDPSGAMEAYIWRRDEVTFIGSQMPEGTEPKELAIDWRRLADVLASPARGAGLTPLIGVRSVEPGTCRQGWDGAREHVLWDPASLVRAAGRGRGADADEMRACVEACVAAHASGAERILCEISGGLDSAIVAGTLAAVGHAPSQAVNFFRAQPEADERLYAQAAADRLGVPLRTVARTVTPLGPSAFELSSTALRPNFNATDPGYDEGLCAALEDARADVLFTGHGGDVVFLQVGAAALSRELLAGRPCSGSRITALADVGRRVRRSIWSLAWEAITTRPSRWTRDAVERPSLLAVKPNPAVHPWIADLHGVPPAKQAQVHGLVMGLILMGATRRAEIARLAHPLLSQPVIELCLSIPAPILCSGEMDRSLARTAFADRLPTSIIERRSKGDISVFLGRTLAASIDFFRPLLLEGRLVAEGLLDRAAVDAALSPEAMIWKDSTVDILAAATLETWLRHWEGRISAARSALAEAGITASRKAKARA